MWRYRACLPNVFDDCSSVGRRLFPRERAVIREVNETVFVVFFFHTGGIVGSESCNKAGYSILFTDLAPLALRRLHFVSSDFRPPSVTASCSTIG